ncbi:MAG: TRAP transporter small permease [Burkholderiaceae bacterium]|nr:TRAP transporter small permease [Burkholderiales bacterium]MCZ8096663.1 TRAP transporter small permease [Burkholderiales bacterium]MCZ8341329.1 TRAP transporter small permease [Burkholderiaceae bacterium]
MKAWSRLMQACGGAAAAILGAVVLAVCWDVFARNLGAKSLPWIVEATEYALPLATFLAAPWLMFRYEHVRLDLLSATLSPRNLARIERIAAAVCLVVSLVIVWYSFAVILDTRKVGSLVIKSLVFPEWWLFVPVPICFLLLAGECARRLVFPPPPTPAAVSGGIALPGEDGSAAR